MHIRYGYRIDIRCEAPTPVIALLDVHPERRPDLTEPDEPAIVALGAGREPITSETYLDGFGNVCRRFVAPAGGASLQAEGIIHDSGFPDADGAGAQASPTESLPEETLVYLLGSRYCETDKLSDIAWSLFGCVAPGWEQARAVCDYVHHHIRFDYREARPTRTAAEAYRERVGVCRDYAHLAITFCRCLNIPARYCNGYLGDIGVSPDPAPMDFNAWFEVWLGDRWWTLDARHNVPRIGRILIARGRDATDVPMLNSFGPHSLERFEVITEEVAGDRFPLTSQNRREHWALNASLRAGDGRGEEAGG
jgi:transglutaminase-like putative cysteine protease